MNKSELIAAAAQRTGLSKKDTEKTLGVVLDIIAEELSKGEKVQLAGFGSFEVKTREARVGRNIRTNEAIEIPASKATVFKASKLLRDEVVK
ncbi:MAG: HU family DNA-binding protein [Oscillospiraceae bacterium]|nr:HU family DNA-binding protein [Oscillospiraceae bacterium]